MDRAPLRPVPARPAGPVDPELAKRHVAVALPSLEPPDSAALALAALVGLGRNEAETGLGHGELAEALARARKELRRSMFPLPGSGWCERAERLISDRLDDALPDGPPRLLLESHLGNCARCVEHERRLVQATDALVEGYLESHPAARPEPEPVPDERPAADLRVVEPAEERSQPPPLAELPTALPPAKELALPIPSAEPAPAAPVETPEPPPLVEEPAVPESVVPEPVAREAPPAEPAGQAAAAAVQRSLGRQLVAVSWHLLFVLALVLTLATLALAVYGLAGGSAEQIYEISL